MFAVETDIGDGRKQKKQQKNYDIAVNDTDPARLFAGACIQLVV